MSREGIPAKSSSQDFARTTRLLSPEKLVSSNSDQCCSRSFASTALRRSDKVGCKSRSSWMFGWKCLGLGHRGTIIADKAYVTSRLGTNLTTDATCPEWKKFLNQIFESNSELIAFLQRAVGHSLTGHVSEQCLFILVGSGANGKTTFLNLLQHLLNDYAATIPMHSLMQQKHETQTNDLAYLVGKQLVVATEGERGQKFGRK